MAGSSRLLPKQQHRAGPGERASPDPDDCGRVARPPAGIQIARFVCALTAARVYQAALTRLCPRRSQQLGI